jgi:hypothetical protein
MEDSDQHNEILIAEEHQSENYDSNFHNENLSTIKKGPSIPSLKNVIESPSDYK